MNSQKLMIWRVAGRKAAVIVLLFATAAASFATLGDGKSNLPKSSLLSGKTVAKPGYFTLKSGYNFRGNQVINTTAERKVIRINTVATIQKGRTTFIVPLKKNVIFDKLKIDFGNRQFQPR
jgi:hypothetical protein